MRILILPCLLIFLVAGISHDSAADVIWLKNGDKLTGTIIESTEGLSIKTEFGTIVPIPWPNIRHYRFEYNMTAGGNIVRRTLENTQKHDASLPLTLEIEKAEAQKPAEDESEKQWLGHKWSGRIEAGASLQTGNSEKDSIDVDTTVKARGKKDRITLGGEYNRSKDEGEITVDNKSAFGIYDYFISKKWFVGGRVKVETDDIDDLDLRTRIGGFFGKQFYESKNLNFQARLGLDYTHEKFEDGTEEDDASYAWALDYDQKIWNEKLQLFHSHEMSVPVDEADGFLLDSESGLRVPLMERFVGTAQVDFDWDNDPPDTVKKDDTKYSLKLGYEW